MEHLLCATTCTKRAYHIYEDDKQQSAIKKLTNWQVENEYKKMSKTN